MRFARKVVGNVLGVLGIVLSLPAVPGLALCELAVWLIDE